MTGRAVLFTTFVLGALAAAVFLLRPELDLAFSRLFYLGDNRFVLSENLAYRHFNDWIRPALWVVAGLLLLWALWLIAMRPTRRTLYLRRTIYLVLVFALGPGLIVEGVLKPNWDRARPKNIVAFGGDDAFSPPILIADQCDNNCSFVSGDAATVFALVGAALLVRRRRGLWIGAALATGAAIGGLRIAIGAHFLSDVIFSAVISVAIAAALYWLFFERSRAARPPPA